MLRKLLFLLLLLLQNIAFANFSPSDSLLVKAKVNSNIKLNTKFSKIDAALAFKKVFDSKKNLNWIKPFSSPSCGKNKDSIKGLINDAQVAYDSLKNKLKKIFTSENLKYVEQLTGNELVQLPIGISGHTTDGFKADMVIVNAKILPQYIELTAFARIETQFQNIHLYFAADKLKLSHDGGVIGDWKLYLLGNETLPQIGNKILMTILGGDIKKADGSINGGSYVEFDCNGFKSFKFKSDIRLARSLVVPVNATGVRIAHTIDIDTDKEAFGKNKEKYVGATLDITASGWNDLLIQIDLPSFELEKLNGWTFKLQNAVVDLSDNQNAPNIVFPPAYTTQGIFPNGNQNTWRGFYAQQVSIKMPKQFNDKKGNTRTEFQANKLLVDNNGVSGDFRGYNVLEGGSATGWQFKIDTVQVKLEINRIKMSKITGSIKPAATNSELKFTGFFNEQLYRLTVKVDKSDFKMFKGKLIFEQNSWVKMELDNNSNEFKASAFLNGTMSLGKNATTPQVTPVPPTPPVPVPNPSTPPAGGTTPTPTTPPVVATTANSNNDFYDFNGIVFQNLALKSYEMPYIQASYFGYPGDCKFGNFPLQFENIHLVTPSVNEVGLAFRMTLNLMESAGISAAAGLKIIGRFENTDFQSYKYDRIVVDEIRVDLEKSGFKINGGLQFFENDLIYGDGFKGDLSVNFPKLDIAGGAKALFCSKDFRFWYVDFFIQNNSNGKFGIEKVEGGLSYKMKRTDGNMIFNFAKSAYVPSATNGFTFRAGVKAKFGSTTSFKAKAFLEMEYNTTGGLNRIYFLGEGAMMGDQASSNDESGATLKETVSKYNNQLEDPVLKESYAAFMAQGKFLDISKRTHPVSEVAKDGKLGLFVSIEKDFVNNSFDGLFEVYCKLEGFKGAGPNNLLGMVHMYSSPAKSYLHIGTPTQRLGAEFMVGPYNVGVGAYFMTGDGLPSQLTPHPRILEILGSGIINNNRTVASLSDGKGFAFGLNFSIGVGRDFGWFYAFLEAGGGFDIMHRQYIGVSCAGRPGPVGNDGWYSMGQVYAYLWGEAGLRVKLFGLKKNIKILELGVAALLRGEFPNPAHLEGYLGIYYNVMGGLISGRFSFKVEIGEKCEFVGLSNPLGISVIASVSPDNETNVDVFKKPQIAFNYAMLQPFNIEDVNGNAKTVRINLKKYELFTGTTPITGELTWTDNNTKVNFTSTDILPPNTLITAKAEVGMEQQSGGGWVPLTGGDGSARELKEFTFTTGSAPEYIPLTNIKYTYPVIDANNFYPQEHQNVYIKLKQGQDYLFNGSVQNWNLKGEILQGDQRKVQNTLAYDFTANKISFPYTTINTSTTYGLKLMAYPQGNSTTGAPAINVNNNAGSLSDNTNATTTNTQTIANNTAAAQNNANANKLFLEYNFITSQHNTFTDKMNSIQRTGNLIEALTLSGDIHALYYKTANYELFNKEELIGTQYTDKSLIKSEAVLDDSYYTQNIYPLIYQNYPLDSNIYVSNRNTISLGMPPIRSIDIPSIYLYNLEINPNEIELKRKLPFRYNLPSVYRSDYGEIKYKIVNRYLSPIVNFQKYEEFKYIIDAVFLPITPGSYKIKFSYYPFENIKSSETIKIYQNNN
jgi:hypothetical protein